MLLLLCTAARSFTILAMALLSARLHHGASELTPSHPAIGTSVGGIEKGDLSSQE